MPEVSSKHLRELAERYKSVAAKLLEAADALDGLYDASAAVASLPPRPTVAQPPSIRPPMMAGELLVPQTPALLDAVSGGRSNRMAQLREFLQQHGPKRRKEILSESGIPTGTVAMLLTKENFDQDEDGRWTIKVAETTDPVNGKET